MKRLKKGTVKLMQTGTGRPRLVKKASPRTRRVLLVDENASELRNYGTFFLRHGYEVSICASYSSAALFLDNGSFDFIVLNQGTQAFEGRTVLERAMATNPYTPVLIMAARHDKRCYLDALRSGALDYWEKPANPDDIVQFVDAFLAHPSTVHMAQETA